MIGFFENVAELQDWARQRAEEAREHYVTDGVLVSLGYALAMNDIAASVVAGGVSTVSAADRGNVIALFEKQAA